MNHFPHGWSRPRDDIYGPYDYSHFAHAQPITHTQSPAVTGTSVIGVKFADGVVLATDNLSSYGSLARFRDTKRIRAFNANAVLGIGGDVSDMQHIDRVLLSLRTEQEHQQPTTTDDPAAAPQLSARNLHTYLGKLMYRRRSKFDPLWNAILVAGLDDAGAPFLASVDLLGTTYGAPALATGFGAHLAVPILRRAVPDEEAAKKLSKDEAVRLVRECMKVLFYRDARSLDEYSLAVVERGKGVELKEGEKVEGQSWAFAETIRGYGTQVV